MPSHTIDKVNNRTQGKWLKWLKKKRRKIQNKFLFTITMQLVCTDCVATVTKHRTDKKKSKKKFYGNCLAQQKFQVYAVQYATPTPRKTHGGQYCFAKCSGEHDDRKIRTINRNRPKNLLKLN